MSVRKNISDLIPEEIEAELALLGEKKFRAAQIFSAIHARGAGSFEDIVLLPKALRQKLSDSFEIKNFKESKITSSEKYNTRKFLFELERDPKIRIETVLISEKGRNTVCVSTQAGCNVGCEFCATGKLGFRMNLSAGEICSQVYEVRRQTGVEITNIVYMGMGEPFLNYANVLKSLLMLTNADGLALPGKRITVSTVGFKGKIKKFADDLTSPGNERIGNVKLALSLHSTDNGLRESIIPTSEELTYYYRRTGNKITYEYIHFPGINDSENDVKRLTALSSMIPSNINIIPFHPIGFQLSKPLDKLNDSFSDTKKLLSNQKLNDLIASLKNNKVVVNLRTSSGVDINAACGQLALAGENL
ncbi:MAG: 23S rRNA (adenine(2503)-C(2))-methyltransferase RlmN [Ignavibacteria bacterium]|nr:23S rRNA (adenine(2503)-C(2))-methyltransferase RlmN [Ignavibacteria bacterium]